MDGSGVTVLRRFNQVLVYVASTGYDSGQKG
jgi:hypothetical protein